MAAAWQVLFHSRSKGGLWRLARWERLEVQTLHIVFTDFTPKNTKSEKLPDGWSCTWENTGSAGTNYWLSVYRQIGKKSYICDTSLDTAEKRDAALNCCKTLKE